MLPLLFPLADRTTDVMSLRARGYVSLALSLSSFFLFFLLRVAAAFGFLFAAALLRGMRGGSIHTGFFHAPEFARCV